MCLKTKLYCLIFVLHHHHESQCFEMQHVVGTLTWSTLHKYATNHAAYYRFVPFQRPYITANTTQQQFINTTEYTATYQKYKTQPHYEQYNPNTTKTLFLDNNLLPKAPGSMF